MATATTTRSQRSRPSTGVEPLDDRVLIRPQDPETTTASGLVIPDTAQHKPQRGEVLATGPGRRAETTGERIPLDVTPGDIVVFATFGGTDITIDGEDHLILDASDVLAIVATKGTK